MQRMNPLTNSDKKKLIHESEGSQIVSELQNEELRHAPGEVLSGNELYADLIHHLPFGLLTLTTDGRILEANLSAAALFGRERTKLLNNQFDLFLTVDTRSVFNRFLKNIFIRKTSQPCEVVLSLSNGSFSGSVQLTGIRHGTGETCSIVMIDNTESKRLQKKLYDSEQRFRSYFELPYIGRAITSPGKGWIDVNQALCDMLGYTKSELMKTSWAELTHPDDLEADLVQFNEVMSDRSEGYTLYKRFIHKDGHYIHTHLAVQCVRFPDRSVEYFAAIILDISELKKTEQTLRKSEQIKSELYENLNEAQRIAMIGSWDWDLMTNQVWWSDETYRIFGLTAQSFTPSFQENGKYIHPDDFEKYQQSFEHSFQTDEPLDIEIRLITRDGLLKHCHSKGKIISDSSGQKIRFAGIIMDITERKQAELLLQEKVEIIEAQNEEYQVINEELNRTNKELSEAKKRVEINEARLKIAQDVSNSGSWDWDIRNNAFYWSDEFLRLFGLPEKTVAGFDAWTKALHPDDVEIASRRIQEAIENRTALLNDYRIIFPGNEIRWIRSTGHVVYLNDKPERMIGMCMDITNQKKVETEIRNLNETLELRIAERTSQLETINNELTFHLNELEQFSYISNHDLQEPLRTMIQFAQLFKEKYQNTFDEEGNKYLEFITNSAIRMKVMVKNLLEYSLLGKTGVTKFIDCNKIVEEVLSDLNDSIKGFNARITVQELPTFKGFKTEMRLLFQNLIVNAMKFHRKDCVPEISISAESQDKEWLFSIRDNGIGIDKKHYDKIFIIFQRLHNRNEFEGTGIGLAHCKKVVEMHGGKIWVDSTPGKGSNFMFTIRKQ
jgi:PAS domain S-box-containing protein